MSYRYHLINFAKHKIALMAPVFIVPKYILCKLLLVYANINLNNNLTTVYHDIIFIIVPSSSHNFP